MNIVDYSSTSINAGKDIYNACSQQFQQTDLIVLSISCAIIWTFFSMIEPKVQNVKSKSWIVMLLSSTVLSVFGCRSYYLTERNNMWSFDDIYGEDFISRCVVLFFVSSNVMDLFLGTIYYPKQLDPLTSIFHHVFYVMFMIILLVNNYSRGFLLCFVMEIPTALLAIGSVWHEQRTDIGFGITFFITRLVYNGYLVARLYSLSPEGAIWKICTGVLCLHFFWFYKWAINYGLKIRTTNVKI